MKVTKIWDGNDPGGTPGRVFTGSIGRETITAGGAFLDKLGVGLKGAVSTAAVPVEDFVDVLSELSLQYGAETRIQCDMNDLIALMALYYGQLPTAGENSDNAGNDFIGGVMVPVQQKVDPAKPFSLAATRTAVTNIGTETLSVTGYWTDKDYGKKPIHAVTVGLTSAAATGNDLFNFRLAPLGTLVGLIMAMPAASDFADGNIDTSFERVKLIKDGQVQAELNTLGDATPVEETNFVSQSILGDLLSRYKRFDLRPEGLDLKSGVWNIQIDNQDASDALRIIPVIEMA